MSLAAAISDWKRFTNSGGFEVTITLTPLSGDSVTIKGTASIHHNSIDTEGMPVNAKRSHITIIESDLTELSYTVRNAKGEIAMRNHLVNYTDLTGIERRFVIKETFPSETVGVITCILGDYVVKA